MQLMIVDTVLWIYFIVNYSFGSSIGLLEPIIIIIISDNDNFSWMKGYLTELWLSIHLRWVFWFVGTSVNCAFWLFICLLLICSDVGLLEPAIGRQIINREKRTG